MKREKPPLKIHVKKVPGDTTSFSITIEYGAEVEAEKQKSLWEAIGRLLAVILTEDEAREFLVKLRKAAAA